MSNHSYVEQILVNHSKNGRIRMGEHFSLGYDYILGHDATFSLIIDEIKRLKIEDYNKDTLILVADHFCPPATIDRANILNKFLRFSEKEGIEKAFFFKGICHQILVEHPKIIPGHIILGADSHTVTAGALGCLAFGLGSYDILYSLATRQTMFRYDKILKILLEGTVPEYISGKDIVLSLLKLIGEDGGSYTIWEIEDKTTYGLSQDDRFAFSNMCIEAGAISAVFIPDQTTLKFLEKNSKDCQNFSVQSYPFEGETIRINTTTLVPQLAKPHSPANIVDAYTEKGTPITQVFIGSCASGRISEIAKAAKIAEGKKVHPFLKAILVPSSIKIYEEALSLGYIQTLVGAGFIVEHPSCGPCGKIDKGVLGDDDICLSTSNRNYQGRMGSSKSKIYLASAEVCAASALEGTICCP